MNLLRLSATYFITDSQGRTVDFKNTILILTSNLGSDVILSDLEDSRAAGRNELSEAGRRQVEALLKTKFRPEFLNRLDETVIYKSLTRGEIAGIVELLLGDLRRRLADKQMGLTVTDEARDFLIEEGYDPVYGARPLKRFIQSRVETLIAKELIRGSRPAGSTITVDLREGKLALR